MHLLFAWRYASAEAPKNPVIGQECEDGPVDKLCMILNSSKATDAELQDANEEDIIYQKIFLGFLVLPTRQAREYRRAGLFFAKAKGPFRTEFWSQRCTQKVETV